MKKNSKLKNNLTSDSTNNLLNKRSFNLNIEEKCNNLLELNISKESKYEKEIINKDLDIKNLMYILKNKYCEFEESKNIKEKLLYNTNTLKIKEESVSIKYQNIKKKLIDIILNRSIIENNDKIKFINELKLLEANYNYPETINNKNFINNVLSNINYNDIIYNLNKETEINNNLAKIKNIEKRLISKNKNKFITHINNKICKYKEGKQKHDMINIKHKKKSTINKENIIHKINNKNQNQKLIEDNNNKEFILKTSEKNKDDILALQTKLKKLVIEEETIKKKLILTISSSL